MVRRPGFLSFVAPVSHSPLQSQPRCGRFGGMDDRANRVVAKPPIGSVNNQPTYSMRTHDALFFMVAIAVQSMLCAGFVGIVVTSCSAR